MAEEAAEESGGGGGGDGGSTLKKYGPLAAIVLLAQVVLAWVVIQLMIGYLGNQQGVMIAIGAHVGGFVAGVLLQRPLLLWRYRRA